MIKSNIFFISVTIILGFINLGWSKESDLELKKNEVYEIDTCLSYFIDDATNFGINSIICNDKIFAPIVELDSNLISTKVIWLKFKVQNTSSKNVEWLLKIGNAEKIEVYVSIEDSVIDSIKSGYLIPYAQHQIPQFYDLNSLIKLNFLPDKTYTVFIKMQNYTGVQKSSAYLLQYNDFVEKSSQKNLIQGLFNGMLIIMILYHLLIFFSIREKSYLHYTFYLFSMLMVFLLPFNYLWQLYVGPFYYIGCIAGYIIQILPVFGFLLFLQSFVHTKIVLPKWNRIVNYLKLILIVLPIISSIVFFNSRNIFLGFLILNISIVSIIIILGVLLFKISQFSDINSRYFVSGSILLAFSAMIGVLFLIFPLGIPYLPQYIIQVGTVFQILIFALGLGRKIKDIEYQNQQTQYDLIAQLEENKGLQNKVNRELEHKVWERTSFIEQQKEEIMAQRDDLENTNKILEDQNHEILEQKYLLEKIHKETTDSINYARRIQNAVLPKAREVNKYLPKSFIFYKPKDIVSGDFYFIKKIDNKLIIVAADCTGHGVPGAFMSILGISKLNEIVEKKRHNSAAEILNLLREDIKCSLRQIGELGEQRDGIDIALCIIDLDNFELNYSGAHCPLIIFRKNIISKVSELIEIKADSQPVGIHLKETPFSNHFIQLRLDDMFYIYSDGYHSQFGGELGRSYSTSRFKSFLTSICNESMEEQKKSLEFEFNRWKNDNPQLDDILVVGAKITEDIFRVRTKAQAMVKY